jgi:hypothetical protein
MKVALVLMSAGYAFLWLSLYALVHQALVSSAICIVLGLSHVTGGYWILFRKSVLRGEG